jgi:transposase
MMGTKERHFAPLINVSVEQLVPQDHFYRYLERMLDLSFVREFVQQTYAGGGRPSIDPVVFFKLQLVMFFEGIRSERQLMRHAADRLSVLWYLGYDLGEPLRVVRPIVSKNEFIRECLVRSHLPFCVSIVED